MQAFTITRRSKRARSISFVITHPPGTPATAFAPNVLDRTVEAPAPNRKWIASPGVSSTGR
jgi:hypothetical protein